jgi:CDP-diacylglycerol--serine O-phosphatidyltransferase
MNQATPPNQSARAAALLLSQPHALSLLKWLSALALILILLSSEPFTPIWRTFTLGLFLIMALVDVFDGYLARTRQQPSRLGVFLHRGLDYPILITLIYLADVHLSPTLLLSKLALDSVLLLVLLYQPKTSPISIRAIFQYITLISLLLMVLGHEARFLTPDFVHSLLIANILFSLISLLYHLDILQKRFIADALSMCNLLCGLAAIYMASLQRIDLSLLFILIGALFDGLDGFAARKFGGTRFGVYSDDIADGVSYGIAPAAALGIFLYQQDTHFLLEALVIGTAYAVFTISRLVYFTLNKAHADPNYFHGVPSTLGATLVLSACTLFADQPMLITFTVGVACILMINFDTQYRHLGRLFQQRRTFRLSAGLFVAVLLIGGAFGQSTIAILGLFVVTLFYGFLPTWQHFQRLIHTKPPT